MRTTVTLYHEDERGSLTEFEMEDGEVWVMTLIDEDEPHEAPGMLVALTPEALIQTWVDDELNPMSLDAQGFPIWHTPGEFRWIYKQRDALLAMLVDRDGRPAEFVSGKLGYDTVHLQKRKLIVDGAPVFFSA